MVEIYASLACTVLGETSSTGRCAQLTTLCHLYNWHLHVREWQQHQSVPRSREIRQWISRAHPERFASTVSLMPLSALALMEHIMPQIMESYTAAVDPIWMWCCSKNKFLRGRMSSSGLHGMIPIFSWHLWCDSWLYAKILHYFRKDKGMPLRMEVQNELQWNDQYNNAIFRGLWTSHYISVI